jgi:hypothetical protein
LFGLIVPNISELKVREYQEYRAWYCGLCHAIGKTYGPLCQLSLTYDMTFLAMLLSGVYEEQTAQKKSHCLRHPIKSQMVKSSPYLFFAADMNILLSFYKCQDDWHDDARVDRAGYALTLLPFMKKLAKKYPDLSKDTPDILNQLHGLEINQEKDWNKGAMLFGILCQKLFQQCPGCWQKKLGEIGYELGRFIFLMDAWVDREKDVQKHRYNPIVSSYPDQWQEEELRQKIYLVLSGWMNHACQLWESLPVLDTAPILRNILYSGVWNQFFGMKNGKEIV